MEKLHFKTYSHFMCMSVCNWVYICAPYAYSAPRGQKIDSISFPGAGVAGGYESSNMNPGNQIQSSGGTVSAINC